MVMCFIISVHYFAMKNKINTMMVRKIERDYFKHHVPFMKIKAT